METRANYILIGAFTVLALIMATIFTLWIANSGLDKSYAEYDVQFEGPIRGVELGGEVRFNGIKVGEVTKLNLDKANTKNVVARIRIDAATPVKSDSVAELEPAGLTGLAYIQILAGSEGAGPLLRNKGQERPMILSQRGQIDRLFQGGEGVLDTSLETISRMRDLLNEKNLQNFALTLENTRRASQLIGEKGQLLDKTNEAAKNIADAGLEVKKLANALSDATAASSKSFSQTAKTYSELGMQLSQDSAILSEKTNSILTDGQALVGDLRNLSTNTNKTISQAHDSLKNLDDTTKGLKSATKDVQIAADSITKTTITVDEFFRVGVNETLPDISAAAKQINTAGQNVDSLVQDLNNNPSAILSKPQDKKVRWKQ